MKWLMPEDDIGHIEAMLAKEIPAESLKDMVAVEPPPMRVLPGGTAVINIEGILLNERSAILDFLGVPQTSYKDIIAQTKAANESNAVRIRYQVNSPGGQVDGISAAMDAIRNSAIPSKTVATSKLASGAYMLASQTGKIEATDDLTSIGSVGVAIEKYNDPKVKNLSNTASPKKRPDLNTDEGVAMVREELDDFYGVIAERIAEGRGITVEQVNENYGQGAVMTARTALKKGLIDEVYKSKQPAKKPAENKEKAMNEEQFKAEHPTVYQAVFNKGVEAGVSGERERVKGHLSLADGSGDVAAARSDIEAGEAVTSTVMAKHQSAFMKLQMGKDRQADNPPDLGHGDDGKKKDERLETKAGLEAACEGLVWEVM